MYKAHRKKTYENETYETPTRDSILRTMRVDEMSIRHSTEMIQQ